MRITANQLRNDVEAVSKHSGIPLVLDNGATGSRVCLKMGNGLRDLSDRGPAKLTSTYLRGFGEASYRIGLVNREKLTALRDWLCSPIGYEDEVEIRADAIKRLNIIIENLST